MNAIRNFRKQVALAGCLFLGPLMFLVGIMGTYRDIEFMTQSVLVEGKITHGKVIKSTKGPDQIRFTVEFTNPSGDKSEGFFTTYDYNREDYLSRKPLLLRYLSSQPDRLQAEDYTPQGWMLLLVGAGMFGVGMWARKKDKKATS